MGTERSPRTGLTLAVAALTGLLAGVLGWLLMAWLRPLNSPPPAAAPLVNTTSADAHGAMLGAAIERIAPAVVTIETYLNGQKLIPDWLREWLGERADLGELQYGAGSGFVVDAKGYVVTNQHVIDRADRIVVRLADGRSLEAELVGSDKLSDIAVLQVTPEGTMPVAQIGDSADLKRGQWVIAVGNPFHEFAGTATAGIISALDRNQGAGGRQYRNLIQTDAAINMGNSGGPLCDVQGRVIGVNSAIFSLTGTNLGIGFAIPINDAMTIARNLIDHGGVPWIGLVAIDVDPDYAAANQLSESAGVVVREAIAGGPAAQAGVQPRDFVVSLQGLPVSSASDLSQRVLQARVGAPLELVVRREGKAVTLRLTVAARPLQ